MAIAAHPSLLNSVLFFTIVPLIPVLALSLSFQYSSDSVSSDFTLYGNSTQSGSPILLTSYVQNSQYQTGRFCYKTPVSLWSASTSQEASFNCSFQFQIYQGTSGDSSSGDGLAFLLVKPSSADVPANSSGEMLALVSEATNGNASNEIVAVEFDTYKNNDSYTEDPNDNHIGVDLNGIKSAITNSELGFALKTSYFVYAWIDYSSSDHFLDVYATNVCCSKPGVPLLTYLVNLSQYLPSSVMVGFSASTGASYEVHALLSWSFNSTDIDLTHKNHSIGWIIGLIAGLSISALFVVGVLLLARRKCRRARNSGKGSLEFPSWTSGPKQFTYKELSVATKNFSRTEQLGQGGFGSVYKGIIHENGIEVAVKRTSHKSNQDEKQFRAEVTIISSIRHRNLVELKGWCHENDDLLLVYEYLPNRSLDHYLFDKRGEVLDWSTRYRVVCELGCALQYLHEECEKVIIHRDVKASNVMLDARFTAKLGDFGLARQLGEGAVAHTTLAAGTIGYMAPECYGTGKATTESDVFSFGAVLLEVACGRRPADSSLPPEFEGLLVNWVWSLYGQERVLEAADSRLEGNFDEEELTRMLITGLACSHPDAKSRPTMRLALVSLEGRVQVPVIPTSKPVAYYGPPPPVSVEELFSGSSGVPTTFSTSTTNTLSSCFGESPEHSLLLSPGS